MVQNQKLDRRTFLQKSALAAGILLPGFDRLYADLGHEAVADGKFLGLVDFIDEGFAPVGVPIGTELDGRFYTDLSLLSQNHQVTPVGEFYIRTAASQFLPRTSRWKIRLDGLIDQSFDLSIQTLIASAKPMGRHLMECAGNVRLTHFGLISVADWIGVPISTILDQVKLKPGASRILISGFDQYATSTVTSIAGASWIFGMAELEATRAFLATTMNDRPLTPDHGAPVRLVVPGWYGCSCIKWVDNISFVADDVEATSQMREYAARTLQEGIPQMARDFQPAIIDHAAMPVRVEKWSVAGKLKYRVVGILWGGSQPVRTLQIRFNPDEDFVPVKGFQQTTKDTWTIWSQLWTPPAPGTYSIRLAITEPQVRTRKMDIGYYVRSVNILES